MSVLAYVCAARQHVAAVYVRAQVENGLYARTYVHMHLYMYRRTYVSIGQARESERSRDPWLRYPHRVGKEIGNFTLPLAIRELAASINMCGICVRSLMVGRGPLVFSILREITYSLDSSRSPIFRFSLSFSFSLCPCLYVLSHSIYLSSFLSFYLCPPSVSYFIDNIVAMDGGHPVLYILKAFSHGYGRAR